MAASRRVSSKIPAAVSVAIGVERNRRGEPKELSSGVQGGVWLLRKNRNADTSGVERDTELDV